MRLTGNLFHVEQFEIASKFGGGFDGFLTVPETVGRVFFTVGFTAIYGELPRTFCQVGMGKISYASWGGGGSRDSHLQCAVGLRPISQRRDVGPPGFAQKVANSHLVISTGAQRSGETPVFCLRWNRSLHATPLRIATKRDFFMQSRGPRAGCTGFGAWGFWELGSWRGEEGIQPLRLRLRSGLRQRGTHSCRKACHEWGTR